jgi:hypothetical protein
VAHRIVRDDRVEPVVGKRQRAAGLYHLRVDLLGDATSLGQRNRVPNPVLVDIHTGDVAAARERQVDRGPPGSAAHFQHLRPRADTELIGELEPLPRGQPAALAQVLSIGFLADRRFGAAREISVDIVVQID